MYVINQDELPFSVIAREFEGADHGGVDLSFLVVEAPPGGGPSLHRHGYAELLLVQEGEARVVAGDEERVVHAGDVVVIPAGTPHAFVNTGDGVLRQLDIHLSARFATEWLE